MPRGWQKSRKRGPKKKSSDMTKSYQMAYKTKATPPMAHEIESPSVKPVGGGGYEDALMRVQKLTKERERLDAAEMSERMNLLIAFLKDKIEHATTSSERMRINAALDKAISILSEGIS